MSVETNEGAIDEDASARRDEILAAHDRWQAEIGANAEASGLAAIHHAIVPLDERSVQIASRIVQIPADTLRGVLAKLLVAEGYHGEPLQDLAAGAVEDDGPCDVTPALCGAAELIRIMDAGSLTPAIREGEPVEAARPTPAAMSSDPIVEFFHEANRLRDDMNSHRCNNEEAERAYARLSEIEAVMAGGVRPTSAAGAASAMQWAIDEIATAKSEGERTDNLVPSLFDGVLGYLTQRAVSEVGGMAAKADCRRRRSRRPGCHRGSSRGGQPAQRVRGGYPGRCARICDREGRL